MTDTESKDGGEGLTRRGFLKKMGMGTVGAGTLAMIPSASSIEFRDNGLTFYGGQSSPVDFDVDDDGNASFRGAVETPELNADNAVKMGQTLESTENLAIDADTSTVVAEEYTANGSLAVNGDMHITQTSSEISHSALQGSHPKSHLGLLEETEITAVGGSTPAFDGTIPNVSRDQTQPIDVTVTPKNAEPYSYAYNTSISKIWNGGAWDIQITVNWDKDPGSGNNVKMKIQIQER